MKQSIKNHTVSLYEWPKWKRFKTFKGDAAEFSRSGEALLIWNGDWPYSRTITVYDISGIM